MRPSDEATGSSTSFVSRSINGVIASWTGRKPSFSMRKRLRPSGTRMLSVGVVPSSVQCTESSYVVRHTLAPAGVDVSATRALSFGHSLPSAGSFPTIPSARVAIVKALSYAVASTRRWMSGMASVRTQRSPLSFFIATVEPATSSTSAPAAIAAPVRMPRRAAPVAIAALADGVDHDSSSASASSAVW